MAQSSLLLFIGDDDVFQRAQSRLPPGALTRCHDALELRAQLAEAALVIIDDGPEAGDALCRRLRDNPASAELPLILCAPQGKQSVWADHVVDRATLETLEPALRELAPNLPLGAPSPAPSPSPSRSPGGYAYSSKAATATPPPAAQEPTLLGTLQSRLEAVNELLASGAEPAAHGELIESTSKLLDESQRAINEALKTAALTRMRELTAARNVLFEKLQRFRSSKPAAATPAATPPPASLPGAPRPVAATLGSTGPVATGGPTKSALTLAAEAKDREARAKPQPAPAPRPSRAARAVSSDRRTALWIGLGAIVLGGAAAVYILYRPAPPRPASLVARNTNVRPHVIRVDIERTDDGLRVRPMATDPEHDPVTFRIRWLVNGQVVRGVTGAELSKSHYPRKATVQVEITPSDGFGEGQPMISRPLRADGDRR